jgi:hypothetical protein
MNNHQQYGNDAIRSPPEPYVRSAFSPFEQEHRHSMSDGTKQQSHFVQPTFNRTPGFGPSPSLPANLKITHPKQQEQVATPPPQQGNPSNQAGFDTGELSPFSSQFFDGLSTYRSNYMQMSDLRRDSQPLPRSSSNLSSRKSERDISSPSPASFMNAAEGPEGGDGDLRDLTGTLKSLNLDGKNGRIVIRGSGGEKADAEEDLRSTT